MSFSEQLEGCDSVPLLKPRTLMHCNIAWQLQILFRGAQTLMVAKQYHRWVYWKFVLELFVFLDLLDQREHNNETGNLKMEKRFKIRIETSLPLSCKKSRRKIIATYCENKIDQENNSNRRNLVENSEKLVTKLINGRMNECNTSAPLLNLSDSRKSQ